jgi:hypothetical protein
MEVNLAYTVTMHDCGIGVIIKHVLMEHVRYDDWQGWPDTQELCGCPGSADNSQIEGVGRRKNDGSPSAAHMN